MFVMDRLKANNAEFGKLYHQISLASLALSKRKRNTFQPFVLDAKKSSLS
jgi:hypothetical protein